MLMKAVPESAGLAIPKPSLKRASDRSCHDVGGFVTSLEL